MQRPDPGRSPCRGKPCAGGQIGAGAGGARILILGAIVAGGRASRFGSDKRAALLAGTPLIEHAIESIRERVADIVVAGRPWGDLPAVTDLPAPGLGPLGGIAAALDYARANGFTHVLTIGCDMPHVPAELLDGLLARPLGYCVDAPILGYWPADLAGPLLVHLAAGGDRSIKWWARAIGALPVQSPVPIANVNTVADLAAL